MKIGVQKLGEAKISCYKSRHVRKEIVKRGKPLSRMLKTGISITEGSIYEGLGYPGSITVTPSLRDVVLDRGKAE